MNYDINFIINLIISLNFLVYLILLKYTKIRFNIIHLLFILIFPIGIGYQVLDRENGDSISYYFWFSFISLCFGYTLTSIANYRISFSGNYYIKYSTEKIVAAVVVLVSAYHIYALGIPILRSDVEVSRFSFGDSGFMGIPSRVFLIVFPIFAIYTLQKHLSLKSKESYGIMIFTWISYFILQIASGFKGSLLVMTIIAAFSLISFNRKYYFSDLIRFKYLLYLLVGAMFAIFVSFQYGSRNVSSFRDGVSYIYQRTTREAAEAGYIVFSEARYKSISYLSNDINYFSDKYFGIKAKKEIFPSDRIISSKISRTPLDDRYFIVSVTTGLASLMYSDFGFLITSLTFMTLGVVIRTATAFASAFYQNGNFIATSILTYLIYNIYVVIVNGNPVYWVINTVIGCIIFLLILVFSDLLARLRSK